MNVEQRQAITKARIFETMNWIENRTGKMLHELDNTRFKNLMDIMNKYPICVLSALQKWYDEIS